LRGGIFIVQGSPGAGKTILGNQICFHRVAEGGRALYVTMLAENHARMLVHIGQLGFFDETGIPECLYYISAFRVLEQERLPALLNLLRREVQAREASILILDGLSAIEKTAGKAKVLGLPLDQLIAEGHVEIVWQPTTEGLLDETCDRLVEAIARRGVRRLFIDGLQGFDRLAPEREAPRPYFLGLQQRMPRAWHQHSIYGGSRFDRACTGTAL
jgi:hypothetical protein